MKNSVKAQLYALTAIVALSTFAFGQVSAVSVLPAELPAGADVDISDGDHHFVQVIQATLNGGGAGALAITFPDEITVADLDFEADQDEVYVSGDAAVALTLGAITWVAPLLTVNITSAIVAGDVISVLVPVETDATPTAGLTYSIDWLGGGALTATVETIAPPLATMSFDDEATGLVDLATVGSQSANARGRFHPNTAAAENFLTASTPNLLDEDHGVVLITAVAAPANPWLTTWDAASAADGDGEITYRLWASQDRDMQYLGHGTGAIPLDNHFTGEGFVINDGAAFSGLIDLTTIPTDGYWFFYITSSASADWALASSDSLYVTHAPTLIDPLTNLVASSDGLGLGIDYDGDGNWENTAGGNDDAASMTLDGGTVLGPDGTIGIAGNLAVDNEDIYWFVDDVDNNARVHIFFVADTTSYDTSDVTITAGVVSAFGNGAGLGIELTTTAFYEDDDTNWVNFDVTSPTVITANATNYIYAVLYDGTYKTVEILNRPTGPAVMPVAVTHHPRLVMHDAVSNGVAGTTDWDTGLNQYFPVSWGLTIDGDKDLDAAAATIILYAVNSAVYEFGAAGGLTDIIDLNGAGAEDVTAPLNALAGLAVTDAANVVVIGTVIDTDDDREDNRYMWDVRNSGIAEGTYHIWGTMQDGVGGDIITMQLNEDPSNTVPAAGDRDDILYTFVHNTHFLANSPFEGEAVELSQADDYTFTWESASSSNSSAGEVQIMLAAEDHTLGAIDYIRASAGESAITGPYWMSEPLVGAAAHVLDVADITGVGGTYTGSEPAIFTITFTAANTYDVYKDGVQMLVGLTEGAGANAAMEGVTFTSAAGGVCDAGVSFDIHAFPSANADVAGYYWIHPLLDGAGAGENGDSPKSTTDGFTASTNEADLTVAYLTSDIDGNADPSAVQIAEAFEYYDVYYFYASDGSFNTIDGAVTQTTGIGVDDIIVVSNYTSADRHVYTITIAAAGTWQAAKDGANIGFVQTITPATPIPIGEGITIDFTTGATHTATDVFTFTVEAETATKADGQLYFNGEYATNQYRLTPSVMTVAAGDTVDLTLQVKQNDAVTSPQTVKLLNVYLDIPTDYLSVIGTADSAMATVVAAGYVSFVNTLTTNGSVQEVNWEALHPTSRDWDAAPVPPEILNDVWLSVATLQVEVTASYSGSGLGHNAIIFGNDGARRTSMQDVNFAELPTDIDNNAADIMLTRNGSITGLAEFEGRVEDNEEVSLFVAKSGSFTPISDAAFLAANPDADAVAVGIQLDLGVGGSFTLTDIPTGVYDVIVSKPGFLSQEETGVIVQAISATTINFQNANKMLGGDVGGYVDADDKSYPNNQIDGTDLTVVIANLGTSPAAIPESYCDLSGDGYVGIIDYTLVSKNVTSQGEGILYKNATFSGNNDEAIVWMREIASVGNRSTYAIMGKDISNLRGFSIDLAMDPEEWSVVSFESRMSEFGGVSNHHMANGFDAKFFSASKLWNASEVSGGKLATIVLESSSNDASKPQLSSVTLVDQNFAANRPVIDDAAGIPSEFSLGQNYPNPFNPTTTINFGLPEAGKVRLAVYNLLGQEVRSLISGTMNAGSYKAVWNSMDNTGRKVSSGVYFYRLVVDGKIVNTRKMLLLK